MAVTSVDVALTATMKGFSGQNYIYDMTHQIYDMESEII
jgi:hypothetical protein